MRLSSNEKYLALMEETDRNLPWDSEVNFEVRIAGRLFDHLSSDIDFRAMGSYYATTDTIKISMDIYCDFNNTVNRLNWVFFHELMHRVGLSELACQFSEIIAKGCRYD